MIFNLTGFVDFHLMPPYWKYTLLPKEYINSNIRLKMNVYCFCGKRSFKIWSMQP